MTESRTYCEANSISGFWLAPAVRQDAVSAAGAGHLACPKLTRTAIVLLLASIGGFAQAAAPAFDVASIKPQSDGAFIHRFQFLPGGRFRATNTWIKYVIQRAYDLKDYQVTGGPAWITSDRFEIDAKAGDAGVGEPQMRLMLQTLLAQRFQLKIRQETKEFPVYDLVVAKGGPKIRALKPGDQSNCRRDNSEICGLRMMPQLADFLTNAAGRPVFDKTEIQGDYDLLLNFDVYEARNQAAPPDYDKPPLAIALQEQLGLKLEPRKASLPVLIIESIHRPTEN
jgi:bla regulator protein BlaR1